MSSPRQRISIYDYPEHLNPFSENNSMPQDKHKILIDKLRKTGTWSLKVSKRLSRSVSWVEKSWLAIEESHKKSNYEKRICNDTRKTTNDIQNQVDISRNSSIKLDHLFRNRTQPAIIVNETRKNETANEACKFETKRRIKRPAPLPPNLNIDSSTVTIDENKLPLPNTTNSVDVNENYKENLNSIKTEQPSPEENETKVNTSNTSETSIIENAVNVAESLQGSLQLEDCTNSEEQSKLSRLHDLENERNDQITDDNHVDDDDDELPNKTYKNDIKSENANISRS